MAYVEDDKLGSTRQLVESSSATSLVLGSGKPLYSNGSPKKQSKEERPVVLSTTHPSSTLGATSEAFSDKVEKFLDAPHEFFSGRAALKPKLWREVMWKKYHAALMQPGEAVGLVRRTCLGAAPTLDHQTNSVLSA